MSEQLLQQILGELQGINGRLDALEKGQDEIKKSQEEIKDMIRDNEGKQGKNHLELIEEIKNIKEEVNFVETISIKNLSDIHKLKVIK